MKRRAISILSNVKSSLQKITWEKEGKMIFLNQKKDNLSVEEKQMTKVLIIKGTPKGLRKRMWMLCSKASLEMKNNCNYYEKLVELSLQVPSLYEFQIKSDLKRTFPDDPTFSNEYFLNQLGRVLICYTIRNSSLGYCQGFNFIAGRLLKIVENEEETFWLFSQLLEHILPFDYFSELIGVITDTTMINLFIKNYMPSLSNFFEDNSFDLYVNNFIHKWIMGLFTQGFDNDTSLLIWDLLFLEGNIIIVKSCLAMFNLLKSTIMQYDNHFEAIYTVCNDMTRGIKISDALQYYLAFKKFEFNETSLNQFRNILKFPIVENLKNENLQKLGKMKINPYSDDEGKFYRKCNITWPYCMYDEQFNLMKEVKSYSIFKLDKEPLMINNYYFKYNTNTSDNSMTPRFEAIDNDNVKDDDDILLERRPHFCQNSQTKQIQNSSQDYFENSKKQKGNNSEDKIMSSLQITIFDETNSPNFEKEVRILYHRISRGDKFKKAKNALQSTFSPKPFLDIDNDNDFDK